MLGINRLLRLEKCWNTLFLLLYFYICWLVAVLLEDTGLMFLLEVYWHVRVQRRNTQKRVHITLFNKTEVHKKQPLTMTYSWVFHCEIHVRYRYLKLYTDVFDYLSTYNCKAYKPTIFIHLKMIKPEKVLLIRL